MWLDYFQSLLPGMVWQLMEALRVDFCPTYGLLQANMSADSPDAGLAPQEQEWADRAIIKYAEAQRKKAWQRWNEAMFEKK